MSEMDTMRMLAVMSTSKETTNRALRDRFTEIKQRVAGTSPKLFKLIEELEEAVAVTAALVDPWVRRTKGGWKPSDLPGHLERVEFLTVDRCDGEVLEDRYIRWYGDFECGLFNADDGSIYELGDVLGWRKAAASPEWACEEVEVNLQ